MVEYGRKIEEEVKAMKTEIKTNIQGTNCEGKETETQINDLEQKEEINIQPKQKEIWIQKNEERLRNLWDNFKHSNIRIIGVPEGEEEKQEIENLFEKVMKNFHNLVKEAYFQEVQEAKRVPKKLDPRKHTPRHIIITLPKIKDEERFLKAARETESYLQRSSHKTISWFPKRNLTGKKGLERSIWSHEKQGPTPKMTLSSKATI